MSNTAASDGLRKVGLMMALIFMVAVGFTFFLFHETLFQNSVTLHVDEPMNVVYDAEEFEPHIPSTESDTDFIVDHLNYKGHIREYDADTWKSVDDDVERKLFLTSAKRGTPKGNVLETSDADVTVEYERKIAAAAEKRRNAAAARALAEAEAEYSPDANSTHPLGTRYSRLLESLVHLEWRYADTMYKRGSPSLILRGLDWVLERDASTYVFAFRNNRIRLTRTIPGTVEQTRRTVSGILCASFNDGDVECLPGNAYKTLKRFQRISRLHGLRSVLWDKTHFCKVLRTAQEGYERTFPGRSIVPFTFPCFVMPREFNQLEEYARADNSVPIGEQKWIIKPPAMGAGRGIYVVHGLSRLRYLRDHRPKNSTLLVQPYLNTPYLLDGYKFDLRTYVLVTSISPLRIYIYKEGLVRLAGRPYDATAAAGGDKTQFLTNVSINKKFKSISELVWTFARFKSYLSKHGEVPEVIFGRIYAAIVKTFMASEPAFTRHFDQMSKGYKCENCYQLMGVDVIFDSKLRPLVIEVNGSPDMSLSWNPDSAYYDNTKKNMMTNVLAINYGRTTAATTLYREMKSVGVVHASDEKCKKARPYAFEYPLGRHIHVTPAEQARDSSNGMRPGTEYWQCLDDDELSTFLVERTEEKKAGGFVRLYPSRFLGNRLDIVQLLRHVATRMPPKTKGTYYYHPLTMSMLNSRPQTSKGGQKDKSVRKPKR